ncbi:MgtC/SapB family protein [Herbaspirillum lusitanum]|uniref:Protein MgtC n=1 Tax=Herbaspirillum lusitanum TaxID=213312 RepID=A0ABW9A9M3_9BURK
MTDYFDISCRLLVAMLIGAVIGIDRNLRGKPTGMKTLGLVSLGAALATMASMNFALNDGEFSHEAVSRAIQGVITGIGFLGAGVIIHDRTSERVRGLTTAASIWVTAAIGIVCGAGWWKIALIATALVLILFIAGRPLERYLHKRWMRKSDHERATINLHED